MAKKTTDDLTFAKAFAFFRKKHGGDGGKFRYKGKVYTTNVRKSRGKAPAKSIGAPRKAPAKPSGQAPGKPPKIAGGKSSPRRKAAAKKKTPSKAPKVKASMAKSTARFSIAGVLGLFGSTKAGQARNRKWSKNRKTSANRGKSK